MSPFLTACIVLITLGVLVIDVAAILIVMRVRRAVAEYRRLADSFEASLARFDALAETTHALVDTTRGIAESVSGVTVPLRDAAGVIQSLSRRVSHLHRLFDEVEPPMRGAVAVTRGIRVGAMHLLTSLMSRRARNGGARDPERIGGDV